ncbi:MAG: acyl carrier protein phosphodiesterase [Saprospiraceae bacterium]|jgi:acyl carrier protein phosphodiesterase
MNYLAHLALSPHNDDIMCGNYLADSIRPSQRVGWSEDMIAGYDLHLRIDRYTDAHPGFINAKKKLRTYHKKYAPVVLDILNDHLLSIHWESYYGILFEDWAVEVYQRLQPFLIDTLPPNAHKLLSGLLHHKYLHVYRSQQGIVEVLERMDRRTKFESDFASGADHLYQDLAFFESCFHDLYRDLCITFDPSHDILTP